MDNRILFLSHNLNRTGAPIALLSLIKWLSANSKYCIDLFFVNDGELKDEFTKYCQTLYHYNSNGFFTRAIKKLLPPSISERIISWYYKQVIVRNSYSVFYANSIALNKHIDLLPADVPLITQVGELAYTFFSYDINKESKIIKRTNQFIAINDHVKNYLEGELSISSASIDIITSFSETTKALSKRALNKQFLIGGSGTVEWRKGSDLFIQLASVYSNRYPNDNVKFIWIGGFSNPIIKYEIEHDLKKMNLSEMVEFVGRTNSPNQYFEKIDIFTMLSREEALGLVCIENMRYGTPVVCFENIGGIDFFAKLGVVKSVKYLDVLAVATSIHELLTNAQLRTKMTNQAYEAIKYHFNIDEIGGKYINCFERQISKDPK